MDFKRSPYGSRAILVVLAFPIIPFLLIILQALGLFPKIDNGWVHLIWIILGFYLWGRLSRCLLVTLPYYCSACGKPEALIVPEEEVEQTKMHYVCHSCGHKEPSEVAWHGG
jgi:DNA-directed RNA polymerase subunit RPC12/RpoP